MQPNSWYYLNSCSLFSIIFNSSIIEKSANNTFKDLSSCFLIATVDLALSFDVSEVHEFEGQQRSLISLG